MRTLKRSLADTVCPFESRGSDTFKPVKPPAHENGPALIVEELMGVTAPEVPTSSRVTTKVCDDRLVKPAPVAYIISKALPLSFVSAGIWYRQSAT